MFAIQANAVSTRHQSDTHKFVSTGTSSAHLILTAAAHVPSGIDTYIHSKLPTMPLRTGIATRQIFPPWNDEIKQHIRLVWTETGCFISH